MEPDILPPDALKSQQGQSQLQDLEPLACVSCRARKLKCDRTKPACTRCVKIQNECIYPESRRKPTFKRRNVRELEARLAQVEGYLREVVNGQVDDVEEIICVRPLQAVKGSTRGPSKQATVSDESPRHAQAQSAVPNGREKLTGFICQEGAYLSNQLIDLGLSETLPPFEVMEELNTIFFHTAHHSMPVVHPGRYMQAFYGTTAKKPPMCLQYAIWAMASCGHDRYGRYSDVFYQRARQYADADEMKGSGEYFLTLFHAQAYSLIASYEARAMLFSRAALTTAKCVRLVQMMGLDRLDGPSGSIPPMLGPPQTWVDKEERRRAFWGAFAIDAHASVATGWPGLISLEDIATRLPASEEAFVSGKEEDAVFLDEVFKGAFYGGFASTIVVCRLFKSIMHHIHRGKSNDAPYDYMHGNYWTRHRQLDNELSSMFMSLPPRFRLPLGIKDPAAVHLNLNLHASIISLNHAAIETADKENLPSQVKAQSVGRLKASAEEVASIVRMTGHQPYLFRSPLASLAMYCAATVYMLFAMESGIGLSPSDRANLASIIAAMEAIGRFHHATHAFLQQACLDIERNNLGDVLQLPSLERYRDVNGGPTSRIPLLARSAVGRHTERAPLAPRRPPPDESEGSIETSMPKSATQQQMNAIPYQSRDIPVGHDTYTPLVNAVNHGLSLIPEGIDGYSNKRKRVSLGPVVAGPTLMYASSKPLGMPLMPQAAGFTLPDRTSPASSPSMLNHSSTGAGTQSGGSSQASPAFGGLGNTPEENRVDLRAFQDRISTPIWEATEEDLMDPEWIRRALSEEHTDAWGFLTSTE